MSSIGRIFLVLNLLLSAAFLGWASNTLATSDGWRGQHEALVASSNAAIGLLDGTISELTTAKSSAEANAALHRDERDQQKSRADAQEQEITTLEQKNSELGASVTKISEQLEQYNSQNGRLQEAKDRAVQAQHEAERERDDASKAQLDAEMAQSEAESKLANANRSIDGLELAKADVEKMLSERDVQLATLVDITGTSLDDIMPQPLITGAVLKAMYDVPPGLVALNKGSEDDVKRGMVFDIFNGKEYKGRVRIDHVRERMCTGQIITPVDGQTIAQGDSATTRL